MILVFIDLLSWLRLSGHSVRRFCCSPGFQDAVSGTSGERRHGRALVPVMGGSGAGVGRGPRGVRALSEQITCGAW